MGILLTPTTTKGEERPSLLNDVLLEITKTNTNKRDNHRELLAADGSVLGR